MGKQSVPFRATATPGIYVRHLKGCPLQTSTVGRCRCRERHGRGPSYKARRRNAAGRPVWSPAFDRKSDALAFLAGASTDVVDVDEDGPTLIELGDRWLAGIKSGAISKRQGRGPFSPETIRSYDSSWNILRSTKSAARPASKLDMKFWQKVVDDWSAAGYSRSTVDNRLAVLNGIYAWASHASRGLVPMNPVRGLQLPAHDTSHRDRLIQLEEVDAVLQPLKPRDRLVYAIAMGSGLRRSEIARLTWADVQLDDGVLHVRQSKTQAGEHRWPPMFPFLVHVLRNEWLARGEPTTGKVVEVSVTSGRLQQRADKAWRAVGIQRFTLHDGRHSYASHLMAAGVTLKDHQAAMGHADLQMTARYAKTVKPRDHDRLVGRLTEYERDSRSTGGA